MYCQTKTSLENKEHTNIIYQIQHILSLYTLLLMMLLISADNFSASQDSCLFEPQLSL